MWPKLSEKAGIRVRYTIYSLCATAITRMFNDEIDEKSLWKHQGTAIRSTKAYEHKYFPQNVSRMTNEQFKLQ